MADGAVHYNTVVTEEKDLISHVQPRRFVTIQQMSFAAMSRCIEVYFNAVRACVCWWHG